MNRIGEILRNYDIKPSRYLRKGKVIVIDTKDKKYVLKNEKRNKDIYDYLKSRSFDYFPERLNNIDDDYELTLYQNQIEMPKEQKMFDMIELVSLLHLKTTYYKDVDSDEYKKIYEDLLNNIEYLYSYYLDIINIIESKVYMAPSEYLLARNISKIFYILGYLNNQIRDWYKMVENKKKQRLAVLHNNLELDHFIKNENSYFISWNKSKIDMPIFDLYKFYLKNEPINFMDILNVYEKTYPLLEDERKLLLILISMPQLITFEDKEYLNTIKIKKILNNIDNVIEFNLPETSKSTP